MDKPGNEAGWLLKKVRRGQVWCALLSLSLGLSVAAAVEPGPGVGTASMTFHEDRALDPSLALEQPARPDARPSLAVSFALAGSFLAFYLLTSLFNGWIFQGLLGEAMEKEKAGVLLLSQFSLALYALRLIVGDAVPESLRTLLLLFCCLLY